MIKENILVLAPHTDDGELGCGGTIAKFCSEGKQVHYVAFSICNESLPPEYPANTLANEVANATRILGIPSTNLILYDFKVRIFPEKRQEILDQLIELRSNIQPDLVLLPNSNDIHQDHHTIFQEGIRAFKNTSILGYEMPWNNLKTSNDCFVQLSEENVKTKIRALSEYKSQAHRKYLSEEYITSLAITRGMQAQMPFAEVFEVIRWMI